MNIKRTEIIDAYLRNELNSEELEAFEGQLAGDPTLQEELGFQRQVVRGLGEFRKAELKSRLTAINIGTPWWELGQLVNPGLVKLTGALITATIIGTGIYYFNTEGETESAIPYTVFESDLNSSLSSSISLFEETNQDIPEALAAESSEEFKQAVVALSERIAPEVVETSAEALLDAEESSSAGEFVPDVSIPNPGDGKEEDQFKSESAKIPMASTSDIINSSEQIDIKTTQKNTEEIRYKYYDGKLHLYGNFKNNPYEIIEINSSSSKQVYLFHNRRYFKLLTTDKVANLPQIADQVLIQELEIVRNNKVD